MCNKNEYSRKEAQTILNERKNKHKKWAKECRVYFCEECQAHHLTSHEEYLERETIELKFKEEWEKLKAM